MPALPIPPCNVVHCLSVQATEMSSDKKIATYNLQSVNRCPGFRCARKPVPRTPVPRGKPCDRGLFGVTKETSSHDLLVVLGQVHNPAIHATPNRSPFHAIPYRYMLRKLSAGFCEGSSRIQIASAGQKSINGQIHSRSHRGPSRSIPARNAINQY